MGIYILFITLFPGIHLSTFIVPKMHKLLNNVWGGLLFSISGSMVLIFASSQANNLIWSVFHFNSSKLSLTHTMLTIMIAVSDWLMIIPSIMLFILLVWAFIKWAKSGFSMLDSMPQPESINTTAGLSKQNKLFFGLVFWIVLLAQIASFVKDDVIYADAFVKVIALNLDYQTSNNISLHRCNIKTVSKNTEFLWIDESRRILSVYQPSPESQFKLGKFKTVTC